MSSIWLCPECGTDCLAEDQTALRASSGPGVVPSLVRDDEKMLLDRARELLAQPAPDYDDLWLTSLHVGALKYFVRELAAALELRREAELP